MILNLTDDKKTNTDINVHDILIYSKKIQIYFYFLLIYIVILCHNIYYSIYYIKKI